MFMGICVCTIITVWAREAGPGGAGPWDQTWSQKRRLATRPTGEGRLHSAVFHCPESVVSYALRGLQQLDFGPGRLELCGRQSQNLRPLPQGKAAAARSGPPEGALSQKQGGG